MLAVPHPFLNLVTKFCVCWCWCHQSKPSQLTVEIGNTRQTPLGCTSWRLKEHYLWSTCHYEMTFSLSIGSNLRARHEQHNQKAHQQTKNSTFCVRIWLWESNCHCVGVRCWFLTMTTTPLSMCPKCCTVKKDFGKMLLSGNNLKAVAPRAIWIGWSVEGV